MTTSPPKIRTCFKEEKQTQFGCKYGIQYTKTIQWQWQGQTLNSKGYLLDNTQFIPRQSTSQFNKLSVILNMTEFRMLKKIIFLLKRYSWRNLKRKQFLLRHIALPSLKEKTKQKTRPRNNITIIVKRMSLVFFRNFIFLPQPYLGFFFTYFSGQFSFNQWMSTVQ